MDIIVITAFCITAALAGSLIKNDAPAIKLALTAVAAIMVFIKTASSLDGIISQIRQLFFEGGVDTEYVKILLKGVGICYLTALCTDICRDCGENTLASQITLAGKIAVMMISLPLFVSIIGIVKSLLDL